jgi:hypothetical protein
MRESTKASAKRQPGFRAPQPFTGGVHPRNPKILPDSGLENWTSNGQNLEAAIDTTCWGEAERKLLIRRAITVASVQQPEPPGQQAKSTGLQPELQLEPPELNPKPPELQPEPPELQPEPPELHPEHQSYALSHRSSDLSHQSSNLSLPSSSLSFQSKEASTRPPI